jgi:hypothetical protein
VTGGCPGVASRGGRRSADPLADQALDLRRHVPVVWHHPDDGIDLWRSPIPRIHTGRPAPRGAPPNSRVHAPPGDRWRHLNGSSFDRENRGADERPRRSACPGCERRTATKRPRGTDDGLPGGDRGGPRRNHGQTRLRRAVRARWDRGHPASRDQRRRWRWERRRFDARRLGSAGASASTRARWAPRDRAGHTRWQPTRTSPGSLCGSTSSLARVVCDPTLTCRARVECPASWGEKRDRHARVGARYGYRGPGSGGGRWGGGERRQDPALLRGSPSAVGAGGSRSGRRTAPRAGRGSRCSH